MTNIPEHDIHHALKKALSEVANRELPDLTPDTRLFAELALDSTSVIELLMALEDSLGLQVDPDELTSEAFETVGTLTQYITACLAGEQAAN